MRQAGTSDSEGLRSPTNGAIEGTRSSVNSTSESNRAASQTISTTRSAAGTNESIRQATQTISNPRAAAGDTEALRSPVPTFEYDRNAVAVPEELIRSVVSVIAESNRGSGTSTYEMLGSPWARNNTPGPTCSYRTVQGIAGLGTAGCAIAGLDLGIR